jgi:N-acetyl-anhydromuramyl-L-alanine amidase AmpD
MQLTRPFLFLTLATVLVACDSSPSPGVVDRSGVRNDALRLAAQRHDVPRETLAVVAYYQGRFEPAPDGRVVPDAAADAVEPADDPAEPQLADAPADDAAVLTADVKPEDAPDNWIGTGDPGDTASAHVEARSYGVMYLSDDQIARATLLTGHTAQEIQSDIVANVDAAAALLHDAMQTTADVDDAVVLLLGLDDGDAAALAREQLDDIARHGFDIETEDGERVTLVGTDPDTASDVTQALTAGSYPPITFTAASSANFGSRNGAAIRYVVIHDIEGFAPGAIQAFKDPQRIASAHYIVQTRGGNKVWQMVKESDKAFHCGNGFYNAASIGIEHEGFADRPDGGGYYSDELDLSAQLVCAIAKKYAIPVDRKHIFGHGNVPSSGTTLCSDSAANAGVCGGASHHHDPGKFWPWTTFMNKVAACVRGTPIGSAPTLASKEHAALDAQTELSAFVWSGTTGTLAYRSQGGANGAFGGWHHLDAALGGDPVAARNRDGTIAFFVRSAGGELLYQKQGSKGFSGWRNLGGNVVGQPAVALDASGRMVVMIRSATTGGLAYVVQSTPGGSFDNWQHLDGYVAEDPALAVNADGRLSVFVKSAISHTLKVATQTKPNGHFGGWTDLDGFITGAPAAAPTADGRLLVFGWSAVDGSLKYRKQVTAGSNHYGAWQLLGGVLDSPPSVARNANGTVSVFVKSKTTSGLAYRIEGTNGEFSAWGHVDGFLAARPSVAAQADGRLVVFVKSAVSGGLKYVKQTKANATTFSGWADLGGRLESF